MKVAKTASLSIFFPCFNDSLTITKLVKQAYKLAKKHATSYEVIVINDGSTDDSLAKLNKLKKNFPKLKIVNHKKNQGYGGALKSGFNSCKKDLIFYTDGDAQYEVSELPLLLTLMTPDVSFINGIKMERQDQIYRVIAGNLHNFIVRWAFWLPVFDTDCDFRLIRREVVQKINLKTKSGAICVELVKKAQRVEAKFRQVSVHHYNRSFGSSQFFKPLGIIDTYRELILLWWRLMVLRKR